MSRITEAFKELGSSTGKNLGGKWLKHEVYEEAGEAATAHSQQEGCSRVQQRNTDLRRGTNDYVQCYAQMRGCAAMRRDHTVIEVTRHLEKIEMGTQEILHSFHRRQTLDISLSSATEALEQFLQAASLVRSSASTVVPSNTPTTKGVLCQPREDGRSIFGDVLSDDRYETIKNWIAPPRLGTRDSASATTKEANGISHQSSLPELMSKLGDVTWMADKY
ncbi:uncharacterized protein RSE6_02618 [Rhynchosporium secalis]|uniref:Uncharacterized protein n=1 Tax=Rhynchosporium secalis TaxID=38038 RepID=A0A1E1M0S4_RHYSE|nr:uncharacterized protein RSE6_02618 [Rhynchosporium secalis]